VGFARTKKSGDAIVVAIATAFSLLLSGTEGKKKKKSNYPAA